MFFDTYEEGAATDEIFCSNENRGHKIEVNVIDSLTNENIENANVRYSCVNLNCGLGLTQKQSYGGLTRDFSQPKIISKLPYCYNGKIIAKKNGYLKNYISYDSTNQNQNTINSDVVNIELKKLIPYTLSSSNIELINIDDLLNSKKIFTQEDGFFYISLNNINNKYTTSAIWCGEDCEYNDDLSKKIELIEGKNIYDVSLFYIDKNENPKGFYFLENIELNTDEINNIKFSIPFSSNGVDEENYFKFDEKVKSLEKNKFLKLGLIIQ